jgi:MFS family permease
MTQAGEQLLADPQPTRSLRDYRLLFGAVVVSTAGDWLYKLALPLLVLRLTGSAVQTAVVYSLEYLPYLVFAPIGGVLSDRYDRRRLLITADVTSAVVIGVVAAFALFGQYHLVMIYLAAFVLSSITPLYQVTFQGMVPGTVPKAKMSWANSRLQMGEGTLGLAGPLLGAAAVAALGTKWALTLDSASFALSALAIASISRARVRRPRAEHATIVGDLRVAVDFIRAHPPLLWGSVVAAGSSFGLFIVQANMITYLVRFRGQPVASVGVVFAALGVGGVLGAWVAPRLLNRISPGRMLIGSTIGGGSATALLLVLHPLVAIAMTWVLVGASTTIFIVTWVTLRQKLVPDHLLGRVIMITRLIAFCTIPIAPVVGGFLMSATGAFWPVITVSAGVQIGVGVLVALTTSFSASETANPA